MKNSGKWTEGRYRAFIRAVLRSGMRRWPPKWEALRAAYTATKINALSGRLAKHYRCAKCKKAYVQKSVQVDHITPVVLKNKPSSWDVYVKRLFCEKENLQVLCKTCHKVKTKKERL